MSYDYTPLMAIARQEFSDIIEEVKNLNENIRILLKDGTYIDVWYSVRSREQRFAFHWE